MGEKVVLQAPITVQLEIAIINDKTGQQGYATFSMPPGRFHGERSQRAQLAEFATDHMPEGFRLMTKREWFNLQFGQSMEIDDDGDPVRIDFAMPDGKDWSD